MRTSRRRLLGTGIGFAGSAALLAACGQAAQTDGDATAGVAATTVPPKPSTGTASEPTPVPWQPLPADGQCQTGMVLKEGDSCNFQYSMPIGMIIDASGPSEIVSDRSFEFRVSRFGRPCIGTDCRIEGTWYQGSPDKEITGYDPEGTGYLHSMTLPDGSEVRFSSQRQSDGTYYIEEASISGSTLPLASTCEVGMTLQVGESCEFPDGGEFYVRDDGYGCMGRAGSFCSGEGISINNISASKGSGSTWTIHPLP